MENLNLIKILIQKSSQNCFEILNSKNENKFDHHRKLIEMITLNQKLEKLIQKENSKENTIDLKSLNLNGWEYEKEELQTFLITIFSELKIDKYLNISIDTLKNFLKTIEQNYLPNLYHSFTHAFDVTQFLFSLLTNFPELQNLLGNMNLSALIISTLVHDLKHPGTTSQFQLKTQSKISKEIKSNSLLEEFHFQIFLQILQIPNANILKNVDEKISEKIINLIHELVLSTDIQNHQKTILEFDQFVQKYSNIKSINNQLSSDELLIICKVLMDLSDISSSLRPFEVFQNWTFRINQEFIEQAQLERNLSIDPNLDLAKLDIPKNSLSFINSMVSPLVNPLSKFLDGNSWFLQNLEENLEILTQKTININQIILNPKKKEKMD